MSTHMARGLAPNETLWGESPRTQSKQIIRPIHKQMLSSSLSILKRAATFTVVARTEVLDALIETGVKLFRVRVRASSLPSSLKKMILQPFNKRSLT